MRTKKFPKNNIINPFYENKILTMKQILKMNGCSRMTALRALQSHGYFTSYNFNAKYYTLVDIPRFDNNGIWVHQNVLFTKFGSLTNAVAALVCNSQSALEKYEIEKILKVNPSPIITTLL